MGLVLFAGLIAGAAAPQCYGEPSVDIQVKDAWIRWLPANVPAGGYMTLINTGSAARVLIGASSPDYGEVGIHQTRIRNGLNDMTRVESVELKPLVPVRFARPRKAEVPPHPRPPPATHRPPTRPRAPPRSPNPPPPPRPPPPPAPPPPPPPAAAP